MKLCKCISLFVILSTGLIAEAQWELLHSNPSGNNEAIQFFNECDGVLCGNESFDGEHDGFIALTNNCGLTWDTVYWHNRPLYDMHFPTEDVGYACGFNTTILKTIDGGETWTDLNVSDDPEIDAWHHLSTILFVDENFGYASKADGFSIFLKTEDGGETWQVDSAVLSGFRDVFFSSDQDGYVTGINGVVLTHNGGESWDLFSTSLENRSYNCVFFHESPNSIGFLGGRGSQGNVFQYNYACLAQSNDGGVTWANNDIHEMQFINEIRFWDVQTGLAVGRNFIGTYNFLKTENGGQTWGWQEYENVAPDLVADVKAVSLPTETTWYAVGSRGCIWKTTNAGGPPNYEFPYSTIGEVSVAEIQDSQFKIYPNPTSGHVTFESDFTIEQVTVYDVTGRQVYATSPRLSGKTYELNMNLPLGVYVVRAEGQGKRSTATLVVQ